MYKGTLYGHWEAIVTFQQLIVLADADGIVDMTPQAICATTSIPIDILEKGLKKLSEPDPFSRTPGEEGRRIICIDEHRPWGWQIVNYLKYKHLKDSNEVRAQTRERVRRHREKRNGEKQEVTAVTLGNAEKRYTDTDTDKRKTYTPPPPSGAFLRFWTTWPSSSRKGSKGPCWEKWRKSDFDLVAEQVISHVEQRKRSADWQKNGGEFIPAPIVYLNKRQWEGAEDSAPTGEVI